MNTRKLRDIEVSPIGMGGMGLIRGWGLSQVDVDVISRANAVTPLSAV